MSTPLDDDEVGFACEAALAAAWATLDSGDHPRARDVAKSVLNAATARGDLSAEAQALACLAHCDRVASQLRRAGEASRRAAQLFKQLGDLKGEAGALTTLAHVCMLLGRNDEAVDSALLCVNLCDPDTPEPHAVLAYNCLGLCYGWGGDYDRAEAALEKAASIARRCQPPVSAYQARMSQAWIEASRLLDQRYQTGAMRSLDKLARLVGECRELERANSGILVMPGLQAMRSTVSLATSGLLAAWQGDPATADVFFADARRSLTSEWSWLDALVHWCEAESAWARQDWPAAEEALNAMRESALAVEHEQLACRAHLLLAQVHERQGRFEDALREHRGLRRREGRTAAEQLGSRELHATSQLGVRQSERHLERALVASRQFERWSMEDALTGIANRRCFEQVLQKRLEAAEAARPLTVAMIDVDQFKSINDRFTHRIGDRVLKTLASLIASQVREIDLPARWAGDEFVILFDAGESTAVQICERIDAAIAAFDWESITPSLLPSVSIGLGQATAGDTIDSVLHRSDEKMYACKQMPLLLSE